MFVTILLFDKNYNLLDATWDQVSGDGAMPPTGPATSYAHVSASYKVKQQGYAYLFISNEHPVNAEAYFDDVTVTHTESPIVAGSDYYPFGLPLDGTEITDEPYRYGYQGQYSEKDSLTGWNQFELRMYDARFGRWISPDPYGQFASPYVGMGNNPVSGTDPDGGMCCLGYDAVAASMALEQAIGPASATLLDEVVVTASRLGGAGLWYAKDIGNFFLNKDGRFSAEFEKDFGGATELAASIDRGFYRFNVNWNGGYNEFAVKLGFTANVALTMGEMSAPNPMAMAVTPSGNVPVTMPVTVPITTVLVHGMLLSSTPAAASETPKPNGLKKFSSKWLPDVPIKAQLKGQLGKLLKRFNVEGYSIEDLVEMTPRQVEEAIKGLPNSSQVFQQLNKALQDGGHYF
jgi:RHS repeat-associated protein